MVNIQDLRSIETDGMQIDADLCIVGSGPAGLSIAQELASPRLRIVIVESGGLLEDAQTDRLNEIESIGAPRVMETRRVRNRLFGGTSHTWTGRCAPFDEIDFRARAWVPHSGWPITHDAVAPFLVRAAPYLGIVARFDDPAPRPERGGDLHECLWQFSRGHDPHDFTRSGPEFLARNAPGVQVLLNATVTEILVTPSGAAAEGVMVQALNGRRAQVRAAVTVLAGGGIENARMLLCSRRVRPAGIGNDHDLVGRFLMDHPRCTIAELPPRGFTALRERYGLFRQPVPGARHFFVRGLALSPQLQEREELLNCAAWITEDRAEDDPWEAAKRLRKGASDHPLADMRAIVSQPGLLLGGLIGRVGRRRGVPHKLHRLLLDCIVEQRPDPESRMVLGDRLDALGMPVTRLDWRISDQEKRSVARLAGLAAAECVRLDGAPPRLVDWIRDRCWDDAAFIDVAHPTGTTRMGTDPNSSVVDVDSRVHGVADLYVVGSSVFPTTGHANPTLMIVGLALRLADHLKLRLQAPAKAVLPAK